MRSLVIIFVVAAPVCAMGDDKTLQGNLQLVTETVEARVAAPPYRLRSAMASLLAPVEVYIDRHGEFRPPLRHVLHAPLGGVVKEVHFSRQVEGGVEVLRVKKDRIVVVLRNAQLENKVHLVNAELKAASSTLQSLQVQLDSIPTTTLAARERREIVAAQYKEVQSKLKSLEESGKRLAEQQALLNIRSPFSGTVYTQNVERLLLARPVLAGQKLMEIEVETGGD